MDNFHFVCGIVLATNSMGKSTLTLNKEIAKEKYYATPLGQREKKIGKFYLLLETNKKKLPEKLAKKVFEIRAALEKDILAYVERTKKEHAEEESRLLTESFDKEIEVIDEFLKTDPEIKEELEIRLKRPL